MKIFGEYEDKRLGPEYLELLTDIKTVINYGKYSNQVISNSPDWNGKEGETLFRFQVNGTGWYYYQYFWVNSGWSFLRWTNSANALVVDDNTITTAMIQNGAVNTAKLKTATSEVSTSSATATLVAVPGGAYSHWPQIKSSDGSNLVGWECVPLDSTITAHGVSTSLTTISTMKAPSASYTLYADYLYHTASGIDYWLWILVDKITKDINTMCGAPDAPACGNGGDFEKLSHPFLSYDSNTQDIILIEKFQAKAIQQEAKDKGLSVLELVNRDYKIDFSQTYPYVPIHSGKFSPEEAPVMVEHIPDYIKVKKLKRK